MGDLLLLLSVAFHDLVLSWSIQVIIILGLCYFIQNGVVVNRICIFEFALLFCLVHFVSNGLLLDIDVRNYRLRKGWPVMRKSIWRDFRVLDAIWDLSLWCVVQSFVFIRWHELYWSMPGWVWENLAIFHEVPLLFDWGWIIRITSIFIIRKCSEQLCLEAVRPIPYREGLVISVLNRELTSLTIRIKPVEL